MVGAVVLYFSHILNPCMWQGITELWQTEMSDATHRWSSRKVYGSVSQTKHLAVFCVIFFFVFYFVLCFWDKISWSLGYPGTLYVARAGLELLTLLDSASALGLCAGIACVPHHSWLSPGSDNVPWMFVRHSRGGEPGWLVATSDLSALILQLIVGLLLISKYEVNHHRDKLQSQHGLVSANAQIHQQRENPVMVPCVSVGCKMI